jgi:hypothetical protein
LHEFIPTNLFTIIRRTRLILAHEKEQPQDPTCSITLFELRSLLTKNLVCRKSQLDILVYFSSLLCPSNVNMASATANAAAETDKQDVNVYSRAYQIEMLEESLKRNVIVAVYFSLRPSFSH